ncbi:MAG: hypothetical protein ACK56F_10430, partial [bacterium]
PPQSARQQRHLAYISEFTTDIRHTPGSENVVADALSRPPPSPPTPPWSPPFRFATQLHTQFSPSPLTPPTRM